MTGGLAQASRAPLRLLVITYYFPPSGGAGVQRALKWVKYLPEHDVEPVVLTVRAGAYPQIDESLIGEVPETVRVVRTRSLDPFGLYARLTGRTRTDAVAARTDVLGTAPGRRERLARWLRANAFVPDARVGWVPFAAVRGALLSRRLPIDALLSTGPPHSAHLAALGISRLSRRPWLADFRDPWTEIHYYGALPRSRAVAALDAGLESRVLRRAQAVMTVSPSWAALFAEKSGRPVSVVYNGFDTDDFAAAAPPKDPGAFVVAHVGSLFQARNPVALWEALARLRRGGGMSALRLRIVGRAGADVLRTAVEHGLDVEATGYVSHASAVTAMRAADVLVLATEPQPAEAGHVPGKLFEYMASGNPVLGLGDPAGDAARLIESSGSGRMFRRDDVEGVAAFMAELHSRWESGVLVPAAEASALARFSRRHQAGELAAMLRDLVVTSPP